MKKSEIIKLYISDLKTLAKDSSDARNSRISDLIEEKESDELLVDSILDALKDLKDEQKDKLDFTIKYLDNLRIQYEQGVLDGMNRYINTVNKFYNQKL